MKFMNFLRVSAAACGIFLGSALAAEEGAAQEPKRVKSSQVCMVNDRFMSVEQIPVQVEGKTYYGCCPNCKETLRKKVAVRWALDPWTKKKVDKATAVIVSLAGGAVQYFESEKSLKKYLESRRRS